MRCAPLRFYTRREIEKLLYRTGFRVELRPFRGSGFSEWEARGRPAEVHVGPLHIAGLSHAEAEEYYATGFLITATKAPIADYGVTSIVIITHNQIDCTRQCADSIRERTDEPYQLIFVDNASSDGTVEYLQSLRGVTVICNDKNAGFPAAANQGIQAATGQQILLLNNDTLVTTGWLRRMLRALYSHPRIGLVGPCTNYVSGTQQITVNYEDLECLDGFAWERGKTYDQILSDTDRAVGFCLLIRREVVDKVGLLDERFSPGNFEDDDYCLRALQAGFRVVIARDAFVHHFGERTFMGANIAFSELLRKNQDVFREKLRVKALEEGRAVGWSERSRVTRPNSDAKYRVKARPADGLLLERASSRISLCLIMRDNERTIGSCLESIRPYVDEMVCVDTGSKDETPRIAERLGARVFHFPWCDSFAAARNESFRHARGDWIFWMDSDDTTDGTNGLGMRRIALGTDDPSLMAFTMKVLCPGSGTNGDCEVTAVDQVKLIRNFPEIRWDRRIHEQIIPAIRRAGGDIVKTDLFLVHSAADHSPEGKQRKLERDLRLLKLELQEFPDHPFTLFNLGMTYRDARQYDEAIDYLKRSIERSGECESHLRKAHALLVSSYSLSGQSKTALQMCQDGLTAFPNDAELTFQMGGLLSDSAQYAEAAECYRKVLEMPDDVHFASVERGINGYLTRHNLGVVYSNMGRLSEAEEQLRLAIAEAPAFRPAIRALGDVLMQLGKERDLEALAERLMNEQETRAEGMILRGQLSAVRGDLDSFRQSLENAVREAPGDLDILRTVCHLLCTLGAASSALGYLEELIRRAPDDPAAHHDLGTVYLQAGGFTKSIESLRESLRLRPDHSPTLLNLAFALKENGQREDALATLARILEIAPCDACAERAKRELDLIATQLPEGT
jgi:GT2 family glycosyltransferase/tetratricopeptide (TPR) repeat protein